MSRRVALLFVVFAVFSLAFVLAVTATRERLVIAKGNGLVKARCLSCGDSTARVFRIRF